MANKALQSPVTSTIIIKGLFGSRLASGNKLSVGALLKWQYLTITFFILSLLLPFWLKDDWKELLHSSFALIPAGIFVFRTAFEIELLRATDNHSFGSGLDNQDQNGFAHKVIDTRLMDIICLAAAVAWLYFIASRFLSKP